MTSTPSLRIAAALGSALVLVFAEAGRAAGTLTFRGGALGSSTTYTLEGDPNEIYFLVNSLTPGPTPFGGKILNVGLELLDLTVVLPGWIGVLSPTGTATGTFPLPNNPGIDGLLLYGQFLTVPGPTTLVDDVSNQTRLTLAISDTIAPTLGTLIEGRAAHMANLLADGRVLLTGGGTGSQSAPGSLDTAELYDTYTEAIAPNASTMVVGRAYHTATTLTDGRVLLAGGVDAAGVVLASCEVYDPANGSFASTGSMNSPRVAHTATLLGDGRVLVTGGTNAIADPLAAILGTTASCQIYNPATGSWSAAAGMADERFLHAATALADGRVLVSGGASFDVILFIPIPFLLNEAQVYNPSTNSWSGPLTMKDTRVAHTSTLLLDGRVLLAGGGNGNVLDPSSTATAELFNPAGSSFAFTGSLGTSRALHSATRLPSGKVLLAGGGSGSLTSSTGLASAEVYDLAAGGFQFASTPMSVDRTGHTSILLPDDTVLLAGGASNTSSVPLASAETYTP